MRRIGWGLMASSLVVLAGCNLFGPGIVSFERDLLGSNEVPPILTEASGALDVTLEGDLLILEGSFAGLEGTLVDVAGTPAHVHRAGVGATGDVVFGIDVEAGDDDRSGTLSMSETLTAEQKEDFESGLYYVNVHSSVHPSGELRAQLHQEEPPEPGSLQEVAAGITALAALTGFLDDTGLLDDLEPTQPYTILAPNNEAVAAAEGSIPTDPATLEAALRYHVLEGNVTFEEIRDALGGSLTTVSGATVFVAPGPGGEILLDGSAAIVKRNVLASNGMIHVIDAVLGVE